MTGGKLNESEQRFFSAFQTTFFFFDGQHFLLRKTEICCLFKVYVNKIYKTLQEGKNTNNENEFDFGKSPSRFWCSVIFHSKTSFIVYMGHKKFDIACLKWLFDIYFNTITV